MRIKSDAYGKAGVGKPRKACDLTGQSFGMLTVSHCLPRETDRFGALLPARWVCRCSCGILVERPAAEVKRGRSCGCLKYLSDKSRQRSPFRRPYHGYFNIKELNEC